MDEERVSVGRLPLRGGAGCERKPEVKKGEYGENIGKRRQELEGK